MILKPQKSPIQIVCWCIFSSLTLCYSYYFWRLDKNVDHAVISEVKGIWKNPFGAGESPCLSDSLFLSSISVAAGRRPAGRVAGQ